MNGAKNLWEMQVKTITIIPKLIRKGLFLLVLRSDYDVGWYGADYSLLCQAL